MKINIKQEKPAYSLWATQMAHYGGIQSYNWRLWEMLQQAQDNASYTITGLSLQDDNRKLNSWPNPTKKRPIGFGGNKLDFSRHALGIRLGSNTNSRPTNVIVGHLHFAPLALFGRVLNRIDRYIVVLHGIEAWSRLTRLQRKSLAEANAVVATTDHTVQICTTKNELAAANFKVIPLCAEPQLVPPDPDYRLDGAWPILFLARLDSTEQYKGLEMTMQAVASMVSQNLPAKLHIVGDGDDRPRLESLAKTLGLSRTNVHFHGSLRDAALQSCFLSAKVFVMPSAKEGFGIVFLEAMRHGVPCIGGAHGGTPEVITDGIDGELVNFGNVSGLIEKLIYLYENPGYAAKLGNNARNRFNENYTFETFSTHWQTILEKTLQ